MQGKSAEAVEWLQLAHALDKAHHQAALNLSSAYILTQKFGQAVAILEQLSQREPDNPTIWQNLGAAYLGNPILATDEMQQRAIAAFKQALALNPAAPHVAYNLGLVYRDRQEHEEAIHWFRRAVQADPHDVDARRLLQRLQAAVGETPLPASETPLSVGDSPAIE
ncbi:MAG: hypothetical protein Fur0021_39630 [Candidatus Promineifilaceae bacterium]